MGLVAALPDGWHEVSVPKTLAAVFPGTHAYQRNVADGHLSVFAGVEAGKWHLSISHRRNGYPFPPGRYPSWGEIKEARYAFCPGNITMAMLLPPAEQWVNAHDTTFHLHQVPAEMEER